MPTTASRLPLDIAENCGARKWGGPGVPAALCLRFWKSAGGRFVTTITRTNLVLRIAAGAAILASAAAIRAAAAQGPVEAVSVDVSECVKLTTPEERLACFEKQVQSSRTNPAAPGATSTVPPPPASGSSSDAGRGAPEEEPADIQARIAELRETVPNAYLITLDNGQVWRQTVPKQYPIQAGHPVRIYYSRWRSYRLTNETLKGFIQVERVR